MPGHQLDLNLDIVTSVVPEAAPGLRDEIASAWGLPLGEHVEICFRGSLRSAIKGRLLLSSAPGFPWDPRQPLQLSIAGLIFSSREIERWIKI